MRNLWIILSLAAGGLLAGCNRGDSKHEAAAARRSDESKQDVARAESSPEQASDGTGAPDDEPQAEPAPRTSASMLQGFGDFAPADGPEPPPAAPHHELSESFLPPHLPRFDSDSAGPLTAAAPRVARHGNPLRHTINSAESATEHPERADRPHSVTNPLRSSLIQTLASPPPRPPHFEPRIPAHSLLPAAETKLDESATGPDELNRGVAIAPPSATRGIPASDDPEPEAAATRAPRASESFQPSGGAAPETAPPLDERSPTLPPSEPAHNDAAEATPDRPAAPVATLDTAPDFTVMRVFYGTDRRPVGMTEAGSVARLLAIGPLVVMLLLSMLAAAGAIYSRFRKSMAAAAVAGILITIGLVVAQRRGDVSGANASLASGPGQRLQYGTERGELQVGVCDVSIPNSHEVGELEGPSVLRLEIRPDPDKHIVVQRVESLAKEQFFGQVRDRVAQSPHKDLFIFVHGYNMSFDTAARRTAQIAKDVDFPGAAIFYSWPSQNDLLGYTVDEQNVSWTVPNLKRFLLEVVQRSNAKSISLIAHSMGNRAITNAIRQLQNELKSEARLFHEVVLAAPDIDADEFKRDIAPALTRAAQHVTLYASSHDHALVVSRFVHGHARAGDSGEGIVVVPGIETVDVSHIDTSLLGHSYYGGSSPIIKDLSSLLRDFRPATERTWLRAAELDGATYWVYDSAPAATVRAPAGDVR